MSDVSNNNKRRPPQGGQTPPPRTTTESFKLNLREEDLATGTLVKMENRRKDAPVDAQMGKTMYYTEKERKKAEKDHKKRNRIKAGKNKRVFAFVWIAMVLLVSFTLGSYLSSGSNDFFAVGREESSVTINVPEKVTAEQLAELLEESGAIKEKEFFKLFCNLMAKDKLQYIDPGSYQIYTNLDYLAIINTLRASASNMETVSITFPEGLNVVQMGVLLEEKGICKSSGFLEAAGDYQVFKSNSLISQMQNVSAKENLLEGYLFPDTYNFYKGADPDDVVSKMLSNTKQKLKILQSRLDESDMTLDNVMILASIIQKEAANVNDMYTISSILHNRLDYGAQYSVPMLQCDSTMYYPYTKKEDIPSNIRETYTSSYNTYAITGLPAGAICNPGMDAIKAALLPDDTDYLYFCHNTETGEAFYASTAEGHEENLVLAGIN